MKTVSLELRAIFWKALDHPSEAERREYLDRACGADAELRSRVEALLRADRDAGDFLGEPVLPPTLTFDSPEVPGTSIGPYKLMEQIGEGGMGVVYVAEQTTPVRRKVALKVIKPGMDTRQVLARFEAERQALAMMDHPNIAKVHDAGATASGRPYFVMELVKGIPITEYCDKARLSVPGRLELFVLVCRAVQHAHQKGIIHRDLKPSNILVTLIDGSAVPKVIDFGIAKSPGMPLTDRTIYTSLAQLVGTPLYMSPEQAELSGVDVDTRSDVYSLGVLLYELLTGTTPIDRETLCKVAYDEIRRVIREQDPPTPSARLGTLGAILSSVSANRQADARLLSHAVRGELDWIVMKALEKDRSRRYETANDFAADVMRHLTDRPVEACPPSAWYRLGKFVHRNRVSLATAGLLVTTLVMGSTVCVWQAMRAGEAEAEAERHAEDTQLVVHSLVNDVIRAAAPSEARGESIRVIELLRSAEKTLPARFRGRPKAEAAFHRALAEAYAGLTHYEEAEQQIRRAVELRIRYSGPEHPETLDALAYQAIVLSRLGIESRAKQEDAIRLGRQVLEAQRRILGLHHPESLATLCQLGEAYLQHGDFQKAGDLLGECLADRVRLLGAEHADSIKALHALGRARHALGDLKTAEELLAQAVDVQGRKFGRRHPETLQTLHSLALVVRDRGRNEEAVPMFRDVVSGMREYHGTPYFPSGRYLCGTLVDALRDQGDAAGIRDLCDEWLREIIEMAPEPDPRILGLKMVTQSCLAFWLATLPEGVTFDADLAVRAARQAAERGDEMRDSNWTRLAVVHLRLGDVEQADLAVRTSMERRRGGDRFDWLVQALIHARCGRTDQARNWLERAEREHDGRDAIGAGYDLIREEVAGLLNLHAGNRIGHGRGPGELRDEARPLPVLHGSGRE
jgi:serine/threonine protein kinase